MLRRRRDLRIAHHDERLRHHQADAAGAGLAGLRNVQALQRRMVAHVVRRVAVRHLPDDLAAIEIDRGDRSVRRLEDRQAVDGEPAAASRRLPQARPRAGAAAPGAAAAAARGLRLPRAANRPRSSRQVRALRGTAAPRRPTRSGCPRNLAAARRATPRDADVVRVARRWCASRDRRRRPASWCRRPRCPC